MPALQLENISKSFGKTKALSNIDLRIDEGRFCVVLGPSGCGKSTLLNLIAGLEEPSSGRIYLGDKDITELPPHKRDIAMVFQNYALYPHLTAYENIAFGLRLRKESNAAIKAKIERTSRTLNIAEKLSKYPRELSGGERQRVATGRAIVREPALFLFDEPLSNLDARLRIELRSEFIRRHRELKKTTVYVTHDQTEAMVLGEEVVVIKDGQIQQVSTPEELYRDPANLFVAEFIGTPPMNIIRLKKGEFKLKIPEEAQKALEGYTDNVIYFGFRPSAVKVCRSPLPSGERYGVSPVRNFVQVVGKDISNGVRGKVIFTETIGEDSFAHIRPHPDIEIIAKTEEGLKLSPQDAVSLKIDSAKIYYFDTAGKRIRRR